VVEKATVSAEKTVKGVPMALDAGFVAAVLEGIEGTLGELIDRVEDSELQANLELLQSRVTAVRVSIIRPVHKVEEPVPMETARGLPLGNTRAEA
jgi:hypothetical protein